MDEYINDVDKDFRLCIKLEKLLSIFYYVSVVISLILSIKFNNILCVTLIVLHILYIIGDTINDMIFKNFEPNSKCYHRQYKRDKKNKHLSSLFPTHIISATFPPSYQLLLIMSPQRCLLNCHVPVLNLANVFSCCDSHFPAPTAPEVLRIF